MLQQRETRKTKDMIHMGSDHRSVMATFVIEGLDKRRPWMTQTEDRNTKDSECSMIQDNGKEEHEERNPIDERYHELECSVKRETEAAAAEQKQ